MTDQEAKQILARLASVEKELARLKAEKAFSPDRIEYFESLPLNAVVGKDYLQWRLGISERAAGRLKASEIPRFSNKPLKWVKRDVEAYFHKLNKPVKVSAAEFTAAARPVKRKTSIIKKPRATQASL